MCDYCKLTFYDRGNINKSETVFGRSFSYIRKRESAEKYELWATMYGDGRIQECTISVIEYCPWCGRRLAEGE